MPINNPLRIVRVVLAAFAVCLLGAQAVGAAYPMASNMRATQLPDRMVEVDDPAGAPPAGATLEEITIYLGPGNTVPMVLVRIPEGTFQMGAPAAEWGSYDWEKPQHEVTLTQAYYLGKTEVTQAQWVAVMGTPVLTECGLSGVGDSYPVYCVSWNDICGGTTGSSCTATSFVGKVNVLLGSTKYRMPTEAEWERAARGETTTEFSFAVPANWNLYCGSFPEATANMWWCGNNTPSGSKPVGTKLANPYGLHDMHGNVHEWVGDWHESYGPGAVTDPRGPSSGSNRVFRGGNWTNGARSCRSADRGSGNPSYRHVAFGFRLAMSATTDGMGLELVSPIGPNVAGLVPIQAHVSGGDPLSLTYKVGTNEVWAGTENDHIYNWNASSVVIPEGQDGVDVTITVEGTDASGLPLPTVSRQVRVKPLVSGRLKVVDKADPSLAWNMDRIGGAGLPPSRVTMLDTSGAIVGLLGVHPDGTFTSRDMTQGSEASILSGSYEIGVGLNYFDVVDSSPSMCKSPAAVPTKIQRLASLAAGQQTITQGQPNALRTEFPLPILLIHGIMSTYEAWDTWLSHLNTHGYLAFATSHKVLLNMVKAEACQIAKLSEASLSSLFSISPSVFLLCHSEGGVAARLAVHEPAFAGRVKRVYTLGTPHTGTVWPPAIAWGLWNADMLSFNGIYPTFDAPIYAIGGTANFGLNDWIVSPQNSVFNIMHYGKGPQHVVVSDPFERTPEAVHEFPVLHGVVARILSGWTSSYFLDAPTIETILTPIILKDMRGELTAQRAQPAPQASTALAQASGSFMTILAKTVALSANSSLEVPVPISQTDLAVLAATRIGAPVALVLVRPDGIVVSPASVGAFPGVTYALTEVGPVFMLQSPVPGSWTMRLSAGDLGGEILVFAQENSAFQLDGGPDALSYTSGATTTVAASLTGTITGVSATTMAAEVTDPAGAAVATVPLVDDGVHSDGAAGDGAFGGTFPAPSGPGHYRLTLVATGTNQGVAFRRQSEAAFDVIQTGAYLTGTFSDTGVSTDEDADLEAIDVVVGLTFAAPREVVVAADLVDSQGYPLDHATASLTPATAGPASVVLRFSVADASCSRFAAPFQLVGLRVADPLASYGLLDAWTSPVSTVTYTGSLFGCTGQLEPTPTITAATPGAAFPGETAHFFVSGSGFASGAAVALSGDAVGVTTTFVSSELLDVEWAIPAEAGTGARDVTVTNPDTRTATLSGAFVVAVDSPPTVAISYPAEGQTAWGTVTASASVADDRGIQKVEFLVDGTLAGTDTIFPYQLVWQTGTLPVGQHELQATVTDTLGQAATATVQVNVVRANGDTNGDGSVNVGDVFYLINTLFAGGPVPLGPADVNADNAVNVQDVFYLINYLFAGGPAPA